MGLPSTTSGHRALIKRTLTPLLIHRRFASIRLGALTRRRRIWPLCASVVPPLLIGLGYFSADPAISSFAHFKAQYTGKSSMHVRTSAQAGAMAPLPERVAELFEAPAKGPRADRYLEIATTQSVERQPRIVLASLDQGESLVTGALSPQMPDLESVNRSGKSELLMTPATFGHAGTAVFLDVLKRTVDESHEEVTQEAQQAALRLPRALASQGETDAEYQQRQRRCLATAIYFEARGEPVEGQLAVAQVVMNRVRSPDFPDTICGVVFQGQWQKKGCQFSFACDGRADVPRDKEKWAQANRLAKQVTEGKVWLDEIGHATYYHATYVKPRWIRDMNRIEKIGQHIFYRFRREKPYVVDDSPASGGSPASGSPIRGLAFSGNG